MKTMRFRKLFRGISMGVLILFICSSTLLQLRNEKLQTPQFEASPNADVNVSTNQAILVGIKSNFNFNDLQKLVEKEISEEAADSIRLIVPATAGKAGGIYRVTIPAQMPASQALIAMNESAVISFAEPDWQAQSISRNQYTQVLQLVESPNDPLYPEQWGFENTFMPQAWDITQGSDEILIAVIDSGIDLDHEDLSGQIWNNPGEIPDNGIDDDLNGYTDDSHGWNFAQNNNDVSDENGHGTKVAGVLGAIAGNDKGIAGVCWNCKILPIKVMQAGGVVNYSDIAAAVSYAIDANAKIINLSIGGYADSTTLRTAIEAALSEAVVVAGAGNDNLTTPFYPASYPGVISVAAVDENNVKAEFSNYGIGVKVAAPGVNIMTTFSGSNEYGTDNGTSLAAPFVSGTAALLMSQHPEWSPNLVVAQIEKTATNIDTANPDYAGNLGSGMLNAGQAVSTDPQSSLEITEWAVDNQSAARPSPGQTFDLAFTLKNEWKPAQDVTAIISENDPYVMIEDDSGSWGDITTGAFVANNSDPFVIALSSEIPYSHPIELSVHLSGSDGTEIDSTFTLLVRSGLEEIPNGTVIALDTTWVSEKEYVLKGSVVIAQGATLTIEPGTVIKVDPEKWIRIDGGIVADGTPEKPITFTSSNPPAKWAGMRFTDTSIPANFDEDGKYLSGSIFRYAIVSYSSTAISLLGKSPYFNNDTFNNNGRVMNIDTLSPLIENCSFLNNSDGVIWMEGGQPRILNSKFTGNSSVIDGFGAPTLIGNSFSENIGSVIRLSASISGTSIIKSNDFINNGGYAISMGSHENRRVDMRNLVFRDNRVVSNGGGVRFASIYDPIIVHNLIAYNGTHLGYEDQTALSVHVDRSVDLTVDPDDPDFSIKGVQFNTIIHNSGPGLGIYASSSEDFLVSNNNWFNNSEYDVYSLIDKAVTFTLGENYWGTISGTQITTRIYDCDDTEYGCSSSMTTIGRINQGTQATIPISEAPAFVKEVIVSPNPLGLQRGTFTVNFSRTMDTSVLPSLTFSDGRGGEVYSVVDGGVWMDSKTFTASYEITSQVLPGTYIVEVGGINGTDGMLIPVDKNKTFTVAYAGGVSDSTPPSRPNVTAIGDGSLSQLTVHWSASDPEGIAKYRYAIGTTPGARDFKNWTYVDSSVTEINLTGLSMKPGQTYYILVSAQNKSGLWSDNGISNPVVAGEVTQVLRNLFLPMLRR